MLNNSCSAITLLIETMTEHAPRNSNHETSKSSMVARIRVSVIIAVFNGEDYIAKAVESILSQDFNRMELIVVDDGSTDRTLEILKNIDDARLRVYRQHNEGQYPALVKGIEHAKGDLIARLDADDVALPGRIKAQVDYLDAHPDCAWLGCGEVRIDKKRNERYVRKYPEFDADIRNMAARCIPYCHSGIMFRRFLIEEGLNYPCKKQFMNDFEFFINVASKYSVANLPRAYVVRTVSDRSFYQSNFSTLRQNIRLVRLCARAIKMFDLRWVSYLFLLPRLAYPVIPNRIKRFLRRSQGLAEVAFDD